MLFAHTDLVSQQALEPLLPGRGDVDGESRSAVHHGHGGSGEQVIGQVHHYLQTHTHTHARAYGTTVLHNKLIQSASIL